MVESPVSVLMRAVTPACSVGFIPVAVHFEFFHVLVHLGSKVSSKQVADAANAKRTKGDEIDQRLAEDTLYVMAGLGLLDLTADDSFQANHVTRHLVENPTKIQGILHFSTEPLMAAAFLYPKPLESKFEYPFKENQTAFQYAYHQQGDSKFGSQHLYATMYDQGRMPSFNTFMEGKFVISPPMPKRVAALGYDLDAVINSTTSLVVVDIGGGNGQMLLEIKSAYPELGYDNLILEEYNAAIHPDTSIQTIEWDAKGDKAQPVRGASIYSLMYIFHNMPDIETLILMKKLCAAMDLNSRLLIHEFSKNLNYTNIHASMIAMMRRREKSSRQWYQLAELSGLKITFEKYPELGEGLDEMRKVLWLWLSD